MRLDISRTMHSAKNHDPVRIRSIVDATLPVGVSPQTFRYMITWRTREIHFGDPGDLHGQISQEFPGIMGTALSDVTPNASQVGKG